jgi:hypothetical protein
VGDYSTWRDGETWIGDAAVVEAKNGSVRVFFDDEAIPESRRAPFSVCCLNCLGFERETTSQRPHEIPLLCSQVAHLRGF